MEKRQMGVKWSYGKTSCDGIQATFILLSTTCVFGGYQYIIEV